MTETLYLYDSPFVVNAKRGHRSDYITEYFDDHDRIDHEKIIALVIKFSLDYHLINAENNHATPALNDNMGSLSWLINWNNFRAATAVENFNTVMNVLASSNQDPINNICDLHLRLGIMFDHKLLNAIVHRTLSSVQLVPVASTAPTPLTTWGDIHKEVPFFWLLIYIQGIIRSTIKPLV